MPVAELEKLLKDSQVIEEIEKHKWFESEKAGRDIGFDTAAEDWYERIYKPAQKPARTKKTAAAKTSSKSTTKRARRSAKSYKK